MNFIIFFLFSTFTSLLAFTVSVSSFQEISDTQGNFGGLLDDVDQFGFSISSIGDLNGDGNTDIVVGTLADDDGGSNQTSDRGAVYILFLESNGTVNSFQKISDTQGNFNGNLGDGDFFGFSVSSIGDLNGDNITDIVVGAPQDDDGGFDRGAVYILFLNSNGTVNSFQKISDTQGNFNGNLNDRDFFGDGVSSIGDLNGDGNTDIVVGAPGDDDGGTNQTSDRGAVYILFLNSNGTVNSFQKISDTQGNFNGNLGERDFFGFSVSSIGDFNGDGNTDIVVGTPFDDDGGSNRGAVYILFLNSNGTVNSSRRISFSPANFPDFEIINDDDAFGHSVSSIGDFNRDGNTDIVVGAIGDDDGGFDRGAVYILFLNSDGTLNSFQKISNTQGGFSAILDDGANFGLSVTSNLFPGLPNLIVGSNSNDGGTLRGSIYILNFEICGNGNVVIPQEECDDGNFNNEDGCSSNCLIENGFVCIGNPSICSTACGDLIITGNEECDDGNSNDEDGCSSNCEIETGFQCGSLCTSICGDGMIAGQETCDDSNIINGDGCSSSCSNESNSSTLSGGAISGIVIGIVVFICILIAIMIIISYFIIKRSKNQIFPSQIELQSKVPILENIEIGESIGSGAFGDVYKGKWNNTLVALKSMLTDNFDDVSNELKVIIDLRHPNILQFYGIYLYQQKLMIVTEFMDKGDLLNVLHSEGDLQTKDLFYFCKQTSIGMEYLHSQNILHRDLACRNILISIGKKESFNIKLSDFGLSRKSEEYYKIQSKKIPVRWTAPEVIEFGKVYQTSDVWSFGIVIFEIFSRGAIPYAGLNNQQVIEKVASGYKLTTPQGTPIIISKIMKECLNQNHSERPSFSSITQQLESISESDFKEENLININSPLQKDELSEIENLKKDNLKLQTDLKKEKEKSSQLQTDLKSFQLDLKKEKEKYSQLELKILKGN